MASGIPSVSLRVIAELSPVRMRLAERAHLIRMAHCPASGERRVLAKVAPDDPNPQS